jgi:hypothetical protein
VVVEGERESKKWEMMKQGEEVGKEGEREK